MTEATNEALRIAEEAESRYGAIADDLKRQCLQGIADGLPAKLDEIARERAQSEPKITMELGADGVRDLRRELAVAATELGEDLRSSAEAIKWPEGGDYSPVEPRHVHSCLFEFLWGRRLDRVASLFRDRGFSVGGSSGRSSQRLIYPQSLYNEDEFRDLAAALTDLGVAKRETIRARKASDRAAVDELWSASESS